MRRDRGLDLGDDVRVTPERQIRIDPFLERCEPQFLQPGDLRLGERLVGDLCQRWAAPKVKGLPQPVGRYGRIAGGKCLATAAEQGLEAVGVQLAGGDTQHVSAVLGPQWAGFVGGAVRQRAAHLRDGVLERLGSGRWRPGSPQAVDQAIPRDDLVAVQEEECEQRALA